MGELVRDSLRMRPDRVIVGEVRTPDEAAAYAETLLSGHARGSYATFHSQSAQEAIKRLCNLGISEQDLPSLDFIVIQRRLARYDAKTKRQGEVRKMTGIYMLSRPDALLPVQALAIFEYNPKTNSFEKTSNYEQAVQIISSKLGISQKSALGIISKRSAFLQKLASEKDGDAVCSKLQKFAYG
jgi:type II secretory ATPase GspE/PulE/Tfp pilus assembly ATPase PilB-like protein